MPGAALMVSGMMAVPTAPLGSVTEKVGVKLPDAVGVPVRSPVASTPMPFGSPVADQAGVPESPLAVRLVLG